MRIIKSTVQQDLVQEGVLSADEAQDLIALIDAEQRYATRESYSTDSIGQRVYETACGSYQVDGVTRWWVRHEDPDNLWHLDSGTESEVVAEYEDTVRQLNACTGDGSGYFDHSDVEDPAVTSTR